MKAKNKGQQVHFENVHLNSVTSVNNLMQVDKYCTYSIRLLNKVSNMLPTENIYAQFQIQRIGGGVKYYKNIIKYYF